MKIDFAANFHLTHDFFGGGSLNTSKIGKRKEFTNINQRGCKIKKNVKGLGVVMDKTGLIIFVFIDAMIFAFMTFVTNTPLWG